MPPKNLLKVVSLTLAAVAVMIFGVGQILADHWQVETRRTLAASPPKIAALVQDLNQWPEWADLLVSLGSPTRQSYRGEAGKADQSLRWTGPIGVAVLQVTAVRADAVDYRWTMQQTGEPAAGELSAGSIEWRADGQGCLVVWREGRQMTSIWERWFAWFGAKQDKIGQIQRSGIEGLAQKLTASPAAGH